RRHGTAEAHIEPAARTVVLVPLLPGDGRLARQEAEEGLHSVAVALHLRLELDEARLRPDAERRGIPLLVGLGAGGESAELGAAAEGAGRKTRPREGRGEPKLDGSVDQRVAALPVAWVGWDDVPARGF